MATPNLGPTELPAEAQTGHMIPYTTAKQQWDRHRAIIEHLYREKNKTLKEVMSIMERDHQFKAT